MIFTLFQTNLAEMLKAESVVYL